MPHTMQPIQSTFVNNRISFSNFWGKSTGFPGTPKSPQIGKIRNGIPQNRYFVMKSVNILSVIEAYRKLSNTLFQKLMNSYGIISGIKDYEQFM